MAAEHVSQQRYETAGELDRVAGRRDELGQLARTFRNMVGEIATREATLRSAEEKLRQSELHYRSLIENTSDIIALIDREGTIQIRQSFDRADPGSGDGSGSPARWAIS